jgi:hypothetical protein
MSLRNPPANKWHGFFANAYLIILTLCGLIDGIAFSFTPKPDTTAISFLSFFDGIVALIDHFRIKNIQSVDTSDSLIPERGNAIVKSKSRSRRCVYGALRVCNRVLMSLHIALVILSVAGAIELALTYRYTNPYVLSLRNAKKSNNDRTVEHGCKLLWHPASRTWSTTTAHWSNHPTRLCQQSGLKEIFHTVLWIFWAFKQYSH